jgi:hypothetical protein
LFGRYWDLTFGEYIRYDPKEGGIQHELFPFSKRLMKYLVQQAGT